MFKNLKWIIKTKNKLKKFKISHQIQINPAPSNFDFAPFSLRKLSKQHPNLVFSSPQNRFFAVNPLKILKNIFWMNFWIEWILLLFNNKSVERSFARWFPVGLKKRALERILSWKRERDFLSSTSWTFAHQTGLQKFCENMKCVGKNVWLFAKLCEKWADFAHFNHLSDFYSCTR